MCYEAGIEVTSLPGPAACITALTLSGLPTRRFAFEAFLPADKKERKLILEELKNETRTIILYEAPHRLVRTLEELKETLGNRRMTLCRELTKRHETAFHYDYRGADPLLSDREAAWRVCACDRRQKQTGDGRGTEGILGKNYHRRTHGNL